MNPTPVALELAGKFQWSPSIPSTIQRVRNREPIIFKIKSIAYSLDRGSSWTKFNRNPVLSSPGLKDFRDPKVSWYPEAKKWIMTLAGGDRILFYSSPDLKTWTKESEFGATIGAHGGTWECPDLVPFLVDGKKIWLLIVNINPGGLQGGSGTQYFVGNFDGHQFSTTDTSTKWADYGDGIIMRASPGAIPDLIKFLSAG